MKSQKITNLTNIGLSVATWLADDTYAYDNREKVISATSLLKPVKQLILAHRLTEENTPTPDVSGRIASSIGTAIHNAIEDVWVSGRYKEILPMLGYPKKVVNCIRVNPTPEEAKDPDIIPIYTETRNERTIMGWTVTGEFDFAAEGNLEDFKYTKVYTYINNTKNEDYSWQGSIYRWINPDLITGGDIAIQFIFSDWKAFEFAKDPKNYPPEQSLTKSYPLQPVGKTEQFIKQKLIQLTKLHDAPQSELPRCTPKELWQDDPIYKYFKNPANAGVAGKRSTKNFTNRGDAMQRLTEDGNVGKIVEVPGKITACKYCAVCTICEQKDEYLADGSLTL